MGEPERLSLEDWWNPEEKLRLLWMGGGGELLESFFNMLRLLGNRKEETERVGGENSLKAPI